MIPKTGSRLPKSHFVVSNQELSSAISNALVNELGGSHRAAKTIMAWTHVSERTARAWLNGEVIPSAVNLVTLSAHCLPVLGIILKLTGNGNVAAVYDLKEVESAFEDGLISIRKLIEGSG